MKTHLYDRGSSWYFRAMIDGKLYSRSIGLKEGIDRDEALRKAKEMFRDAYRQSLGILPVSDVLGGIGPKRDVCASVAEYCAMFRLEAAQRGEPSGETVEKYIQKLYLILRDAGHDPATCSLRVLTAETVEKFIAARLAGAAGKGQEAEDSARRSIHSMLINGRAMFSPWMRQKAAKKLRLPNLDEFLAADAGVRPGRALRMPGYGVRRSTWLAGKRLWQQRDPMAAAFLLAFHCGMRAAEIADARWGWVVQGRNGALMDLRNRPGEGTRVKGTEGMVPMNRALVRRLEALRVPGCEFIVPCESHSARMKMVTEALAKWLGDLGWTESFKRAHELRRIYGRSIWDKHGPAEAKARLRHASIVTTERHYTNWQADWRPWELWAA